MICFSEGRWHRQLFDGLDLVIQRHDPTSIDLMSQIVHPWLEKITFRRIELKVVLMKSRQHIANVPNVIIEGFGKNYDVVEVYQAKVFSTTDDYGIHNSLKGGRSILQSGGKEVEVIEAIFGYESRLRFILVQYRYLEVATLQIHFCEVTVALQLIDGI